MGPRTAGRRAAPPSLGHPAVVVTRALRSSRTDVVLAGAARLGFAGWFLARPDALANTLGVAPSATTRTLARIVAVREVVLGVGALSSLSRGRAAFGWVSAMAAADAVNGAATLVAALAGVVPRRRAIGLAAFDLLGTAWEAAMARGFR